MDTAFGFIDAIYQAFDVCRDGIAFFTEFFLLLPTPVQALLVSFFVLVFGLTFIPKFLSHFTG